MPKFSLIHTFVCPSLVKPIILSVRDAGTIILLMSLYPLRALYKTTRDYCLFNRVMLFKRSGILSVRTTALY